MTCRFTIDGKTYVDDEFKDFLRRMEPDEAAKYMHGVKAMPSMPFEKTWHELATKRLLRFAAEHGYARVSWDTGETNAARYDLSRVISKLRWYEESDGSIKLEGDQRDGGIALNWRGPPEKLDDAVGKDVADKIRSGVGKRPLEDDEREYKSVGDLRGLDLKVGGEGMKGFYDKILPAFVNKYAKKWGAKVEEGRIETAQPLHKWVVYSNGDRVIGFDSPDAARRYVRDHPGEVREAPVENAPVHSVPITESMRQSVLRGQPMFARAKPLTDVAERKEWAPRSEVTPEGTRLIYRPEFAARSAQLAASLKAELDKMGLGKIAVRVADQIRNEAGGTSANAYYFRRMITMALDTENPLKILNHEVIHALKDMGLFTPGEWRILEAEARRKWLHDPEIADRLKRYGEVSDAERLEESIAMAAERGLEANPSPFAQRIFSRLRDFFRALGNALKGNGFATPESIFRGIREGELGERLNAKEGEGAPKFASESQFPQTATRAFRDWFGNSKVVDADGNPLRVYHGTAGSDIEQFLPKGGGDAKGGGEGSREALEFYRKAVSRNDRFGYMNFRSGTFFSPDPEYAGHYVGENETGVMYPVYIKAENPIYFDMVTRKVTGVDPHRTPDALILTEGGKINEIAVIDPTQIKSAVGNRGTFDPNDPRIQFARRDEPTTEPGALDARGKPLPQTVMPGMEKSAKQAAASREAEGKMQPKSVQKAPGGLFADKEEPLPDLFGKRPKFALRDDDPRAIRSTANLIEALTAQKPASLDERGAREAAIKVAVSGMARMAKNLNAAEALFIFPRTVAYLHEPSARLWNVWQDRAEAGRSNAESLRRIIDDSLTKLGPDSRNRVYAALELARRFNWRPADNGTAIRVKNTSYWQAQHSKVGDNYLLSPAETKAFHDTLKLGDESWRMFMRALAARDGWKGEVTPQAIRAGATTASEGTPQGKQLLRLAAVIEDAQQALNRPYFPASRRGEYFVLARRKITKDTETGGGFPPAEWFETVDAPTMRGALGLPRLKPTEVEGVNQVIEKLRSKRKPDGSLAFPEDQYDITPGDFRSRPKILNELNIPQVEKLFMTMEREVTENMRSQIVNEGDAGGIEATKEAKERYQALLGETKDALMTAIYRDLQAGFKKPADLIPGYSADFDRAIGEHIGHIGRNAADMAHRPAIDAAFNELQTGDSEEQIKNYWKDWRTHIERAPTVYDRGASTVAQYGAAFVMGMNPATTFAIASHTPLMAAPVLGIGGNMGQATAQLLRALREAYGQTSVSKERGGFIAVKNLGRDAEEKAFLSRLADAGLLHSVGADDVRNLNQRQSALFGDTGKPLMGRAMDIATSNLAVVDQANRSAIALAAYRMAKNPATLKKMLAPWLESNAILRDRIARSGDLTPEEFAKFMLDEASGAWGKTNQAVAMRGWEGSLIFALHGFQTRFLSTAWKLANNMGPSGKVGALWMMGGLFMAAGVYGLPFTQDGENAATQLWKLVSHTDPMIDAGVRKLLSDAGFGNAGADALLRGPVASGLGIDLASRIGFGDILTREFTADNVIGTIPSILTGRLYSAYARHESGQGALASAGELLPNAARNVVRATSETGMGAQSAAGRQLRTADKLTGSDEVARALGFQPLSASRAAARTEYDRTLGTQYEALKQYTVHSWANLEMRARLADDAGDKAEAAELRRRNSEALDAYERSHTTAPITNQQLSDAIEQMMNPEFYAFRHVPKGREPEAVNSPYP